MTKYYRIVDDLNFENRWFLGNVNSNNLKYIWPIIRVGRPILFNRIYEVLLKERGIPLDFTFADFEVPVVSNDLIHNFSKNEVQSFPAKIIESNSTEIKNKFSILVVNNEIDCINEDRSIFKKFEINDEIRPDKAGHYRSFMKLIVDTNRIPNNLNIFRVKKFNVAIIVSEIIKKTFEIEGYTGINFIDVS